jgi:hypothetical protein
MICPNNSGHFRGTVAESLPGLRQLEQMGMDLSRATLRWTYPHPTGEAGVFGTVVSALSQLEDTSTCKPAGLEPLEPPPSQAPKSGTGLSRRGIKSKGIGIGGKAVKGCGTAFAVFCIYQNIKIIKMHVKVPFTTLRMLIFYFKSCKIKHTNEP